MQTVAALERYRFASGAEEKIVRTFQAPGNFVENLRRLCGISANDEFDVAGNEILKCKFKFNVKKKKIFISVFFFCSYFQGSLSTIVRSF